MDEINFTKRSFLTKDYSDKGTNTTVDQQRVYSGFHSVIVAVSAEKGLERYDIFDRGVDGEDFANHLKKLRKRNGEQPLAILMD